MLTKRTDYTMSNFWESPHINISCTQMTFTQMRMQRFLAQCTEYTHHKTHTAYRCAQRSIGVEHPASTARLVEVVALAPAIVNKFHSGSHNTARHKTNVTRQVNVMIAFQDHQLNHPTAHVWETGYAKSSHSTMGNREPKCIFS